MDLGQKIGNRREHTHTHWYVWLGNLIFPCVYVSIPLWLPRGSSSDSIAALLLQASCGREGLPVQIFKTQQRRTTLDDPRVLLASRNSENCIIYTFISSTHLETFPLLWLVIFPRLWILLAGTDPWVCLTCPTWRDRSALAPAVGCCYMMRCDWCWEPNTAATALLCL